MITNYLTQAIRRLRPESEFSYTDNDYSTIKWDVLEGTAPTQAQIDKAIKDIQAEESSKAETDSAAKAALLNRLGITADEAKLLLS
jgi:hypothetical protein